MLSMLGRLISTGYLVLWPTKPKIAYTVSVLIQVLSYCFFIIPHYYPGSAPIVFIVGMLCFGLGRGIYIFPLILLSQYFNRTEDSQALNIWIGLGIAGNILAFYLGELINNCLHWNWIISILSFSGLYLLSGFLVHAFIDEIEISNHSE